MRPRHVWMGLALAAVPLAGACSFDTDRAAPYVVSATSAGACGTTETLFGKLLEFVREGRFAGLKEVIEARLVPSASNPAPDPSMRTLIGALVRFIGEIGLDRAKTIADLLTTGQIGEDISPLLVTTLDFMDGKLDGRPHYEAANGAALFVRDCNPDYLLTAIEGLIRFESPSHGGPWLAAVADEARPLLADPTFAPFLASFEREGAAGRPAIVGLVDQIMLLVSDDGFTIDRVRTLLQSAVYPVVKPELRARIEVLVALLDEATRAEAGILVPLQGALRCGLQHPAERDAIVGFIYDLTVTPEVDLVGIFDVAGGLVGQPSVRAQLGLFGDAVHALRTDLSIRDDLRALIATLLSSPNVELVAPVMADLLERGVVAEVFQSINLLLEGCGR